MGGESEKIFGRFSTSPQSAPSIIVFDELDRSLRHAAPPGSGVDIRWSTASDRDGRLHRDEMVFVVAHQLREHPHPACCARPLRFHLHIPYPDGRGPGEKSCGSMTARWV